MMQGAGGLGNPLFGAHGGPGAGPSTATAAAGTPGAGNTNAPAAPENLFTAAQQQQQQTTGAAGLGGLGGVGGIGGLGGNRGMGGLPPITPEMMQQMAQILGGGGLGNTGAGGAGGGWAEDPALQAALTESMMTGTANNPWAAALGAGLPAGGAAAAASAEPPEVRYQVQLEQLQNMGFTNASQNVRALLATGGNVHAAIDYILNGGGL